MTDAWVTDQGVQNFAVYHNFPKFLKLALDNKTSLPQAVRKMTGATADRYGIPDRGYIREGYKADITLIDLEKLAYTENREEYARGQGDERTVCRYGEFCRGVRGAGVLSCF